MITPFHLQTIAEASAARLVECLVEGTLIALCAALALRLRRQHNSGTRFAVWFSALMAIAAMPFLVGTFSSIASLRNPTPLHHSAITLPSSWALYLFAAWGVIATLSLSRVFISLLHVHTLRKSCSAINPTQLDPRIRETLGSTPSIALCTSDQVQVPTAIGFFKPAVVIPAWLLDDLSPEELNQILLHELAHLRRRDDWTNLVQQIVKALFFFHPAVWWIERKLSLEREMACDDAVLAATAQPRAYAECLAHLAETTFAHRSFIAKSIALAQAAIGRMRHTTLRVAQILDPARSHASKQTWKPAFSLIAAFAVGSIVYAAKEPQLIAFKDSSGRGSLAQSSQVTPHSTRISFSGSNDSSINSWLKPIPASFITPRTQKANKIFHLRHQLVPQQKTLNASVVVPRIQQPNHQQTSFVSTNLDSAKLDQVKVDQAKLAQSDLVSASIISFVVENDVIENAVYNPSVAQTASVRPASSSADAAISTETIFVITEDPGASASGQPIYQIHFWRVTVLHPVAASKPIPNKET
jgi:beta-lactamase regulating signal transducer with metallopeptidase domain